MNLPGYFSSRFPVVVSLCRISTGRSFHCLSVDSSIIFTVSFSALLQSGVTAVRVFSSFQSLCSISAQKFGVSIYCSYTKLGLLGRECASCLWHWVRQWV